MKLKRKQTNTIKPPVLKLSNVDIIFIWNIYNRYEYNSKIVISHFIQQAIWAEKLKYIHWKYSVQWSVSFDRSIELLSQKLRDVQTRKYLSLLNVDVSGPRPRFRQSIEQEDSATSKDATNQSRSPCVVWTVFVSFVDNFLFTNC